MQITGEFGWRVYEKFFTQFLQLFCKFEEISKQIVVRMRKLYIGKIFKIHCWGFPGGAVVENLPANAGDTGSSPGLGGSHMPRSN